MDPSHFDEFGNYIGPELSSSESVSLSVARHANKTSEAARHKISNKGYPHSEQLFWATSPSVVKLLSLRCVI